jgi:tRNA(Ile)-lysidine synthase
MFYSQVAPMLAFPERVQRSCPELHGPGIVAVSGGADSVALLRALSAWAGPLIVAHLNHRLRGADSDADEQFVRDLAAALGAPFMTTALEVAGQARREGANLEGTARRLRYEWLARVAGECGAAWIATGHTADDQAETVLHRVLRGAGVQGLRGIARQRNLSPGVRLVRPLLDVTRSDVTAYLRDIDQPWREDLTNRDPAYTRNRIRHELLPLLRSFNPAVVDVLGRLAAQANEVHQEQEASARRLLEAVELPAAGGWRVFDAARLGAAAEHHVRGMFRLLWEREGWSRQDMSFAHWKRLVALVRGEETATDLPGGIRGRRRDDVVQVGRPQTSGNE